MSDKKPEQNGRCRTIPILTVKETVFKDELHKRGNLIDQVVFFISSLKRAMSLCTLNI
jgi:hypothetical protein